MSMKSWTTIVVIALLLLSVIYMSVGKATTGPRAIVLTGQPAPGTNGGVIASVTRPSVNGLGDVAFRSRVTGSAVLFGIFLARGGSISRIALSGELAPNGLPFGEFGEPALNDSGQVAFRVRLGRGFDNQGVFFYSGTSTSTIAVTGQNAPGTSGTFGVLGPAGPLLNNAGKIAFPTVDPLTVASTWALQRPLIELQRVRRRESEEERKSWKKRKQVGGRATAVA